MNLILLALLFAILILIFNKKEHFGRVCKSLGWGPFSKDLCFNLPTMPNANSIFNSIKTKIKNEVLNPVVEPITNIANKVKNAGEIVGKNTTGFINMLKNIRIENR